MPEQWVDTEMKQTNCELSHECTWQIDQNGV